MERVTVFQLGGVPVRVLLGARRYRVAEDPAPQRVIEPWTGQEWDLVLVSMQPPAERLAVTIAAQADGSWLLIDIETI